MEDRMKLEDYDYSKVNKPRPGEPTILLRLVEGAGVAVYRSKDESPAELIVPAHNIFQYRGGYTWGYMGTGPQNLSHAISAKLFQGSPLSERDLKERAVLILERVISKLDKNAEHDIKASSIEELFNK